MRLDAPVLLTEHHDLSTFDCGETSLNHWLRSRSLANQASGASRTFIACVERRVYAYYSLSSGSISSRIVAGRFRRNMPDPIPVVLLGRMGVDVTLKGQGIGRALIKDAGLRVSQAAGVIGIGGIIVHPLSEEARQFYLAVGFDECPGDSQVLAITLSDLLASIA